MLPYYKSVCSALKIAPTPALVAEMEAKNVAKLKELQDKIDDSVTNLGETEISDAMIAKASHLAEIGEKVCQIK
jgi:26S proteasome regulatory subunit N7